MNLYFLTCPFLFLNRFFIFRPMKNLEKNPENLPDLVDKKKEENNLFRNFIRMLPAKQIDFNLSVIFPEVESEIDCTQCGNCCLYMQPGINSRDISILANQKNMDEKEFEKQFVEIEKGSLIKYMKARPCTFLHEKICSIYESRPHACSQFPFINESQIRLNWKRTMEFYKICPIVFNTIEKLKAEVGFDSRNN